MYNTVHDYINAVTARARGGAVQSAHLTVLRDMIAAVRDTDGTVFCCGNGGSGTIAEHLALGLGLNVLRETGRGMRAVALGASGAALSGSINDFGAIRMFAAQLETLARPGDLVIGLSASGKSANVTAALDTGSALGLATAAIVGMPGPVSDAALSFAQVLNEPSAAICEDITIMLLHWLYGSFMEVR